MLSPRGQRCHNVQHSSITSVLKLVVALEYFTYPSVTALLEYLYGIVNQQIFLVVKALLLPQNVSIIPSTFEIMLVQSYCSLGTVTFPLSAKSANGPIQGVIMMMGN